MFGNPSSFPAGKTSPEQGQDPITVQTNMDKNNPVKPIFGAATSSPASTGFVFGMTSPSTVSPHGSSSVFGSSSVTSFNRSLFGNNQMSTFSSASEGGGQSKMFQSSLQGTFGKVSSTFTTEASEAKKSKLNSSAEDKVKDDKAPSYIFGREVSKGVNAPLTSFPSSTSSTFRFASSLSTFSSPSMTSSAPSETPLFKKPQISLFGGTSDQWSSAPDKNTAAGSSTFASKVTTSSSNLFGNMSSQNKQNVFSSVSTAATFSLPSSTITVVQPSNQAFASNVSENVFRRPLDKSQEFSVKTTHSKNFKQESNSFRGEKSKETTKRPPCEDKKASKRPKEYKVTSEKEMDPSGKRLVIHRPTISGNLFGQALAGIKKIHPTAKDPVRRRRMSEEETEARSRGHDVRLIRTEELTKVKSIVCKGIPEVLNENLTLRKMFSEFGNVQRVFCNPMKQLAIIHFLTHESAALAKQNGAKLFPNSENVAIFWSQLRKKSPEIKCTTEEKKRTEPPELIKPVPDKEVEEELRSMSMGVNDFTAQSQIDRPPELTDKQTKRTRSSSDKSSPRQKKKKDSPISLTQALQKQAITAADRFLVLDARDKLLRQHKKKQSNLATAEVFLGTCPDMCPEKELYLREDKGQLHPYEIEYSSSEAGEEPRGNPKTVIKEYSRSSADQEEPLPHELRPISALTMTMDHLICNVMDRLDHSDHSAEWYDFLWNRMRSIRKDITQQHLCDITTVKLVEKCARFHIHCSEQFCEEDMRNFDQKINNENLTKCLQTLKHFYHDLGLKNIACVNEPEFRGYDVLLNLNEGNILWQVQQLKSEIQSSPEVHFALQAFAALNSNNYVRFFKLVKKASYLNACIMHRYFVQVRSKALHTLTRACCPVSHTTPYPLRELTKLLGFQDEKETQEFCSYHSLSVKGDNVVLDKMTIIHPEVPVQLVRSKNLIEIKRTVLVGEIVNGGPLPVNPSLTYKPSTSFTSDGYLKPEILKSLIDAISATKSEKQEKEKEKEKLSASSKTSPPLTEKEAKNLSKETKKEPLENLNEILKDLTRDVILEELHSEIREICHDAVKNSLLFLQCMRDISTSYLHDASDTFIREIVAEMLMEEKLEKQLRQSEAERKRQEEEKLNSKMAAIIVDNLCSVFIESELQKAAIEEIESVKKLNALVLDEFANSLHDEIFLKTLLNEVSAVAEEVFKEIILESERQKKLAAIANRLWLLKIAFYFNHWKSIVTARQKIRKNAQEFPCVPGGKHVHAVNTLPICLLPVDNLDLDHLFDITLRYRYIREKFNMLPLSMKEAAHPIIEQEMQLPHFIIYWKVLVSLPKTATIEEWLHCKLGCKSKSIKDKNKIQLWSLHSLQITDNINSPNKKLSLCVKAVKGQLNADDVIAATEKRDFLGSHGLLFILESPVSLENKESFWNENYSRLFQLLKLNKFTPPLPVVFILNGWTSDEFEAEQVIKYLSLEELKVNKLLSCYSVQQLPADLTTPSSSLQLSEAMKWLAKNKPSLPSISEQSLMDFIDDCIMQWYSTLTFQNLAERMSHHLPDQTPDVLISLYNEVINHAILTITSPSLVKISWPVVEFIQSQQHSNLPSQEWNLKSHFSYLEEIISWLKLPSYKEESSDDWDLTCHELNAYVTSLSIKEENKTYLRTKIHKLLNRRRNNFMKRCRVKYGIADCIPNRCNIPWTEVFQLIIEAVISNFSLEVFISSSDKVIQVYFLEEEFKLFEPPLKWRKATQYTNASSVTQEDLEEVAVQRKLDETNRLHWEDKHETSDLPSLSMGDNLGLEHLFTKIQIEKEKAREFSEKLASYLQPLDHSLEVSSMTQEVLEEKSVENQSSQRNKSLWEDEYQPFDSSLLSGGDSLDLEYLFTRIHSEKEKTKKFIEKFERCLQPHDLSLEMLSEVQEVSEETAEQYKTKPIKASEWDDVHQLLESPSLSTSDDFGLEFLLARIEIEKENSKKFNEKLESYLQS